MGRAHDKNFFIRVPLDMIQFTDREGKVWPVAFDWHTPDGSTVRVDIDKVLPCVPCAEQNSGAVGDRYECEIAGQTEYLYYSLLAPRKWFRVIQVSEAAFMQYYKLQDEEQQA